jgi:hypothetical protein
LPAGFAGPYLAGGSSTSPPSTVGPPLCGPSVFKAFSAGSHLSGDH